MDATVSMSRSMHELQAVIWTLFLTSHGFNCEYELKHARVASSNLDPFPYKPWTQHSFTVGP